MQHSPCFYSLQLRALHSRRDRKHDEICFESMNKRAERTEKPCFRIQPRTSLALKSASNEGVCNQPRD